MVRKIFAPEQIINKLTEAAIHINQGISISEASRKIGMYVRWRALSVCTPLSVLILVTGNTP